jgi:phosphoribosylamine-glycine ligase
MRHAGIYELRAGVKNTLHEAAEESRRRRAVEAVVVVKDAYAHEPANGKPIRMHEARRECN